MSRPSLEMAIVGLAKARKLGHLTLSSTPQEGGMFQANHRAPGETGYKVAINDDPVEALLDALSPRYSETWEEHLRVGEPEDDWFHLI